MKYRFSAFLVMWALVSLLVALRLNFRAGLFETGIMGLIVMVVCSAIYGMAYGAIWLWTHDDDD